METPILAQPSWRSTSRLRTALLAVFGMAAMLMFDSGRLRTNSVAHATARRIPPFLIFSAIGDAAVRLHFLDLGKNMTSGAGGAGADIVLGYYGNNNTRYEELSADPRIHTTFRLRGTKFQLLWAFAGLYRPFVEAHEWLAIFDDDLTFDAGQVAAMLDGIAAHGRDHPRAAVYSPAHSPKGRISHPQLIPQGCACPCSPTNGSCAGLPSEFRQLPFVEMSWPVFRTSFALEFLNKYSPLLPGWGIDLWFSSLAKELGLELYVADSFPSHNPQPKEKGMRNNGLKSGEMREEFPWRAEIFEILMRNKTRAVNITGTPRDHANMLKALRQPHQCCKGFKAN